MFDFLAESKMNTTRKTSWFRLSRHHRCWVISGLNACRQEQPMNEHLSKTSIADILIEALPYIRSLPG